MDKTMKIHMIKYALYSAAGCLCIGKAISHLLDAQRHETVGRTVDYIHDILTWIEEKYPESGASIDAFCKEHYDEIMGYFKEKFGE